MQLLFGATFLVSALTISIAVGAKPTDIQQPPETYTGVVESIQPIKTKSRFRTNISKTSETIPKKTEYKDNPEIEAGIENILDQGQDGLVEKTFEVTLYDGIEYERKLAEEKLTAAQSKIIERGTKIIWKRLDTPDGPIQYWKKIRVWATQYDSHCLGCNERTATGMRQGKGVIAVDPKVIKLYSKIYIPMYGLATAGDVGGAVKGNIIDLGFEDARTSGWITRFIDIYLLD